MKYLVIGAGASGIISSLRLSKYGEVILLEKNDKIGKKILVTGNGKCNLWNSNLFNSDIDKYYYTDNYDVFNKLFKDNFNKTYKFLTNDLNIYTREKDTYIYPYSNTSFSVRELFDRLLKNNPNIDVHLNEEAISLENINNKIQVTTNISSYIVDKVVISTGSKASELGTNSLDLLLNKHNIKINKVLPSLVPISLDEKYLNNWNGIRVNAKLKVECDDITKYSEGELQLTDYGISGIVTFNISGFVSRMIDSNRKVNIYIDFMPEVDDLFYLFKDRFNNSNKTVEELLETFFNYKLLFIILNNCNIDKNLSWKSLSDEEIKRLVDTIKNFKVNVINTLPYKRAQVTTGGISLDEVDDKLMLKKLPNVYVTGEILDIDGICGGYNLALAFTSGYMMGDIND